MHDSLHWRAIDPLDLTPDEWLADPLKYVWSCNLGVERPPPGEQKTTEFHNEVKRVDSVQECKALAARWNTESRRLRT